MLREEKESKPLHLLKNDRSFSKNYCSIFKIDRSFFLKGLLVFGKTTACFLKLTAHFSLSEQSS